MTARRAGVVATILAAVVLAACEAPLGPGDEPAEFLAGEWVACLNDGAGDYSRHMTFYPDSFSITTRTFATSDRSCGGAETGSAWEGWRYRLAGEVTAQLGAAGAEVLAREVNIENSFETLFTIVYVDERSTPRLLYFGDLARDPLQDGSAPEKRPDVLSASTVLVGE